MELVLKLLGIEEDSFKFNNWIYNNSVQYLVTNIEYLSVQKYELTLEKKSLHKTWRFFIDN